MIKERITFGHVVNHRSPKGTRFILEAFRKIREGSPGLPLGFLFAERIPHKKALALYKQIDVMIEQVVIGWYGLQAVECMARGIPVMVYIHEGDAMGIVPDKMLHELPIIWTTKDSILDSIKMIISDPSMLKELAARGKRYVKKWHSAETVAAKIENDLREVIEKGRL